VEKDTHSCFRIILLSFKFGITSSCDAKYKYVYVCTRMCVTAQAFLHVQSKHSIGLWYSGCVSKSWIYYCDHKMPCPFSFPVIFWELSTAMHWLTAEYHLLWLAWKISFIREDQLHLWKCSISTVHNPHTHIYNIT